MAQTVSNERLCRFAQQMNRWFRMVEEGTLDPNEVDSAVQEVIGRSINQIKADVCTAYFGRGFIREKVLDYVKMVIKMDPAIEKMVNIVVDEEYVNSVEGRLGLDKKRTEMFRVDVRAVFLRKYPNDPNYDFMDHEYLVRAVIVACLEQAIPGRTLLSAFSREATEENRWVYKKIIDGLIGLGYTPQERAEAALRHYCSLIIE